MSLLITCFSAVSVPTVIETSNVQNNYDHTIIGPESSNRLEQEVLQGDGKINLL